MAMDKAVHQWTRAILSPNRFWSEGVFLIDSKSQGNPYNIWMRVKPWTGVWEAGLLPSWLDTQP
jgi:hypothetical protein